MSNTNTFEEQCIAVYWLFYKIEKEVYSWMYQQEKTTEEIKAWLESNLEEYIRIYKDEFNIKKLSKRKLKWLKNEITKES
jgi:hypothetical protein